MRPLRVLDLFSGGAGGWSLGLHWAGGFETVAMCESDPLRREMLAINFPGVKIYDEVRKLTSARLRADGIWPIDIIVGSPPCQDASAINQKGKGVEGEETRLVFEFTRLVRQCRPALFGFENSNFLIRRGGDRAFDELDAARYSVWPLELSADAFGARHERDRLYCIGWNADRIRACANAAQKSPELARQSRQEIRSDAPGGFDHRGAWRGSWVESLGDRLRRFDGVSPELARGAAEAFGDAIVPQIAEACGHGFKAIIVAALQETAPKNSAKRARARASANQKGSR